jgi:hypothetical protein
VRFLHVKAFTSSLHVCLSSRKSNIKFCSSTHTLYLVSIQRKKIREMHNIERFSPSNPFADFVFTVSDSLKSLSPICLHHIYCAMVHHKRRRAIEIVILIVIEGN